VLHALLDLRPTPFDHPDVVRLIAGAQQVYRERYGDEDAEIKRMYVVDGGGRPGRARRRRAAATR